MKKTAFITLLLLSVNFLLYAETKVSGSIEKSESWTAKLSPYIIDGTTTVGLNCVLTIAPGTTVKFKEGAKLLVKGALYIKGDIKNPARLLSYDNESFYDGIVFQSRFKSIINNCIMIRGTITSEGTPFVLNNCYILNSTGVLLKVFADAQINNTYFYNNTYGVYVEGKNAKFVITGNTFNKNRFALYFKEMQKDGATITGNNFLENKVSVTNYTPDTILAKDNYWGMVEEADISRSIFDRKNNPKIGEVMFRPFAKAPLRIFQPPDSFISLVKIYLSLKRPDEEPARISFGAGADYFYILSPKWAKDEFDFGKGLRAEFTFNITGAFKGGIEAEILSGTNAGSVIDFNFSLTQFLATFYSYIGYKKNLYFVPFIKTGMGVGLVSREWKSVTGQLLLELGNRASKKSNDINYAVFAGLGAEYFVTRFFAIKAEALYNATLCKYGTIMFPMVNLTACFYFDTPFYLNQK